LSDQLNPAPIKIPIKKRLHILLRASFGFTFWLFAGFAILMGMICYFHLGAEVFTEAVIHDVDNLLGIMPRVVAALTLAGFIWILMPRDKFSKLVGRYKGFSGLVLAEVAGIITPGGPSAAFPFLAIIGRAGADKGVMITYITSWALLGIQRVLVWDLPFMGADITTTRFLVTLPLPIIAGLIAQRLPLNIKLGKDEEQKSL
jgi:uncharacterized membrane protein YraQ (UPF0718 family)